MSCRPYSAQMPSCMYSSEFSKDENPWTRDQLFGSSKQKHTEPCGDRISPADGEDAGDVERQPAKQPLREKNRKNCAYRHVPHKDKPPQVVARRNARERRRVQAVNTAFVRLRKAVPVQNTRGKRISKVKTLQNAIEYIRALQRILQEQGSYGFSYEIFQGKYVHYKDGISYFDDLNFEDSNE